MGLIELTVNKRKFKLDKYIKQKLDNILYIINKGWDAVFLFDGFERSGKSTMAITCAWYLSKGKITIDNIAVGCDDCIKKIGKFPDKSILILDESSLIFYSKDAMKKEMRKLIKILNVVGQKNMIFIVVLPSYFDLVKDIAIRRSKFLIHVYPDEKMNRGRFAYFGEYKKRILYIEGKKNYGSYRTPRADTIGLFDNFMPFGTEYLDIKKQTLLEALKGDETAPTINPVRFKRDILLNILRRMKKLEKTKNLTSKEVANLFGCNMRTIQKYTKEIADTNDERTP